MSKKLWRIIYSNARAAVRERGTEPQRIYPYCGLTNSTLSKNTQKYINECARYVLIFCGGVWEDS